MGYNRSSKSLIPKYNIKCSKTNEVQPFMSPNNLRDVVISERKLSRRFKEELEAMKAPSPKGGEDKKKAGGKLTKAQ